MTPPPDGSDFTLRHDINNILGKIIGAAELALDQTMAPEVRAELNTIIRLAEEGGQRTAARAAAEGAP